jgi:phenylalanyl-tRNA synthetase alpha chain
VNPFGSWTRSTRLRRFPDKIAHVSAPNKSFDQVEVTTLSAEVLAGFVAEAISAITAANSLDELKEVRLAHTGDRSPLSLANREIGALPPAAKAEAGKRMGESRGAVNAALAARTQELEALRDAALLIEESVDVTTATGVRAQGGRHPLTTIQEQIADVFVALGYQLAEGPEVESEWLNFDALNIAPDNPARTMQDTFFIGSEDSGIVLRTHTSPVQIRSMLNRELPIYVICPGRVFRTDELDSTHSPVFHQVEGLVIDTGITMADLKGTLDHFAQAMFGEGIVTHPAYRLSCWYATGAVSASASAGI